MGTNTSPHPAGPATGVTLRDVEGQLQAAERGLSLLWAAAMPDLLSDRTEGLVDAHRAVHEALAILRRTPPAQWTSPGGTTGARPADC